MGEAPVEKTADIIVLEDFGEKGRDET